MSFRITGLSPQPFRPLFGLSDEALSAHGARRLIVDGTANIPDRIEVRDAEPGESVLLLNYEHQPAKTPFQASHAIFVREWAGAAYDRTDEIPPAMRTRTLSLRAFDADDFMIDADLVDGREVQTLIARMFADPKVAYIHAHYAKWGCYAARIDRG
jgi:hypothetical protein